MLTFKLDWLNRIGWFPKVKKGKSKYFIFILSSPNDYVTMLAIREQTHQVSVLLGLCWKLQQWSLMFCQNHYGGRDLSWVTWISKIWHNNREGTCIILPRSREIWQANKHCRDIWPRTKVFCHFFSELLNLTCVRLHQSICGARVLWRNITLNFFLSKMTQCFIVKPFECRCKPWEYLYKLLEATISKYLALLCPPLKITYRN